MELLLKIVVGGLVGYLSLVALWLLAIMNDEDGELRAAHFHPEPRTSED